MQKYPREPGEFDRYAGGQRRRYIRGRCAECGGPFEKELSAFKRGAIYCSQRCGNRARSPWRGKTGALHPGWRGGVSAKKSRYRKRYEKKYPGRARAYQLVRDAVKAGRLVRGPCADCGTTDRPRHGHHEDYRRPLAVVWLCAPCHRIRHGFRK